ncbi:hypothetical protein GDO78_003972 [Eleutherodactylus coqui]|uniref:Uncharacterized protein n=1 Tax=Eleutherodactylus coqui TaxID=57060 RepID=A0A8J6EVF8_ELECQ|nr:hypothetical protein GDO78_003972 [Eleutherodactylus coqui]
MLLVQFLKNCNYFVYIPVFAVVVCEKKAEKYENRFQQEEFVTPPINNDATRCKIKVRDDMLQERRRVGAGHFYKCWRRR